MRLAGWGPFVTSCVLFTSLSLVGSAQNQAPTFRSKVEIVQLDVSVLDKHRHPVRGLTQQDFSVLEDGKPQKIVGFTSFDVGDDDVPATGWMRDVPPDVTTNTIKPESRLFVIVIDDGLIPQDPYFIQSSRKILTSIVEKIGPDDLTAIVFTGDNRKTQDFTNDKAKLLATIDKFNPGLAGYRFGLDTERVDVDVWFYQSAVRTLGNLADYLIAVPNRRKALFWVSPGVPMSHCQPLPDRNLLADPRESKCSSGMTASPTGIWADMFTRLNEIFRNAQRANVTMYPIDPGGLGGMRFYLEQRFPPSDYNRRAAQVLASAQEDFLAMTAANTGGRTVMNINDFEPGIRDIFEENSSYYLIGFEPTNAVNDGTLRRIQVKVNRPDVEVRTRSGYYAPAPEKVDKKKAAMTPEAEALGKAIGGLLPTTDLPMRIALAPFAVPGQSRATVTVALGIRQPVPAEAAKQRLTETTELQISAFTPEGDPRGTQRHTAKITLRQGADGEAAYEVLGKIDLLPGRYRLRLAAHNATSKKDGSVFADVIVPDYSNLPVSASPIVLSASPARPSAPKDLLSAVLPIVPTAEREFANTDKVTALLRLYQSGTKPIERAQVTIRIRDEIDGVNATDAQTIAVDQFRSAAQDLIANAAPAPARQSPIAAQIQRAEAASADTFANLALRTAEVRYELPMARLVPGPHLLSVEITMGTTVMRRDVRFSVK